MAHWTPNNENWQKVAVWSVNVAQVTSLTPINGKALLFAAGD
jgi:hypothetical protein